MRPFWCCLSKERACISEAKLPISSSQALQRVPTRTDKEPPSWGSSSVEAHLERYPTHGCSLGARSGFGIFGLFTCIYDEFSFRLSEGLLESMTCNTPPRLQCWVDLSGHSFELLTNTNSVPLHVLAPRPETDHQICPAGKCSHPASPFRSTWKPNRLIQLLTWIWLRPKLFFSSKAHWKL